MAEMVLNGAKYFYIEQGGGDETVVFAHGFLMDHMMFRHQIEALKENYRIIAFDWRGQGNSEPVLHGHDMDDLYNDMLEFFEKLNLNRVHWVGVSMGGFIGMRLAARNPGLLKSLVLADTSDEAEVPVKKIRWGVLAYIFKYFGPGAVTKGIQKALFGKSSLSNPDFKNVLDEYADKWKKLDRDTTFKIAWAIFNRKPVTDELKNINAPTMIIVGEEDVARPVEEAGRLQRRIKNARLEIIPESGHSTPLEQPGAFNRLLRNFLESI
jgi:pimeloyl-ACP methyl ester carboxylesterase